MTERATETVHFDPKEHVIENCRGFQTRLGEITNAYGVQLAEWTIAVHRRDPNGLLLWSPELCQQNTSKALGDLIEVAPEYFNNGRDPRAVANEMVDQLWSYMARISERNWWKKPEVDYNLTDSIVPDQVGLG